MNYIQAKEYLTSINSRGIIPGLDTIRKLLERLGNPQDKLSFVHIAGTNGKGSVGAYLSYILAASGYRVGRYLSPAVFDDCEIIQILEMKTRKEVQEKDNDKDQRKKKQQERFCSSFIKKEDIARYLTRIKGILDNMTEEERLYPTIFEIETAMAFLEFLEKNCDIVVLETGMGGAKDATNIVKNVACSIFVSISRDHMAFLGDTLEEIAEEKAGIIKEAVPVVSAPQKPQVKEILEKKAKEKNTEISFADIGLAKQIKQDLKDGISFVYCIEGKQEEIFLPLLGMGQVENAITSLFAVEILRKKQGYHITEKAIKQGFFNTVWLGRFQILRKEPLIIIDGAHNEAAAEKLAESIKLYLFKNTAGKKGNLIYVLGIFKDKEIEKIIEKTAAMADIILTVTLDSKRSFSSYKLKEKVELFWNYIGKKGYTEDCKNPEQGWKRALELAKKEDTILIFGSLSLLHSIPIDIK